MEFAFPYDDISKPYRCRDKPSSSHHLPPVVFLTPSTVYATTYLASLFHLAAILGFTLQGISLPHSHDASSTPLYLLDGSPELAARSCPRAPLIQSPPSRFCSMWKSVVRTLGVSLCSARSLPEFPLLQVLLSLLVPHTCVLPFIALWPVCRVIHTTGVQRFENQEPDRPFSRPADLREVLPCLHELAPVQTRTVHSLDRKSVV